MPDKASQHFERADSRSVSRYRLVIPARIVVGETSADATILDLSENGCLLETAEPPAKGSAVGVDLVSGRAKGLLAKVVWVSGQLAGCQFDSPLPTPLVDEARIRGAPFSDGPISGEGSLLQLASEIGAARRAAGLSATELAKRAGVSRPTLWSWETARRRPSQSNLASLCDALDAGMNLSPAEADAVPEAGEYFLARTIDDHRTAIARELGVDPANVKIRIDFD